MQPKNPEQQQALIEHLSRYATAERLAKFERVLAERTRYLTVALEDIYQAHNASAVVRSCDAFGLQDVHIIENRNPYQLNPGVSLGSEKWCSLLRYHQGPANTAPCLSHLREQGYLLAATTLNKTDVALADLPLDQPVALIFGTELEGISETVFQMADRFVQIPMYGFAESFNISVSAALCLYETTTRLRRSGLPYGLSEAEKQALRLQWLRRSVRKSDEKERGFWDGGANQ